MNTNIKLTILLFFTITVSKAQLQYSSQFGSFGTGNGQFNSPSSIAIDTANSTVYVCDKNNHRIQKFTLTGTYISSIGSGTSSTANGEFNSPVAITLDDQANLYVNDAGNERIQKFNSSGTYQEQWSVPGATNGMAVNGGYYNLYVIDRDDCKILKVDNFSAIVSEYSNTCGTGNNEYNSPSSLFYSESLGLFVADNGNNRFQRISYTGTHYENFGISGSGNGQFNNPSHISVNENGIKYVCDAGNNRIQKLDYFNSYISQFGSYGTSNGQFDYPICSAISKDGSLYVVDQNNNRIQILTENITSSSKTNLTPFHIYQNNNLFTIETDQAVKQITTSDILGRKELQSEKSFSTSLKGLIVITVETTNAINQQKFIVE